MVRTAMTMMSAAFKDVTVMRSGRNVPSFHCWPAQPPFLMMYKCLHELHMIGQHER
jgi:hypothetical protein